MIKNILTMLFKGDIRSSKAKKNILASFLLKGLDGIVYLAVVPLTLGFMDPYSYGLWLAINSVLMWINSFDIGLGNGLRNCLATAVAKENYQEGKIFISTTYFLLTIIVFVILGIFFLANQFIDWYSIFNIDKKIIGNLNEVITYSFLLFCFSFILKILGSIYQALQAPAISSLFKAFDYIVSLSTIIICKLCLDHGSLMLVAMIFSASPLFVYATATPITFWKIHPELRPSFHLIKPKEYAGKLLVVGINFFIMQMCVLILQFTTNVIISHLFGPSQVTTYNIANRYMYIGILLMTVILAPIWSAVTDAKAKNDWEWIKRILKKIEKTMLLLGLFLVFLVAISNFVYKIWIGNEISIPLTMTTLNAIYVFLLIWSTGQSTFLNGMNILRVQLIANIFQVAIFFPVLFTLGEKIGIYGLVLGLIIVNIPAAILNTIQVKKIINGKANGIWLK